MSFYDQHSTAVYAAPDFDKTRYSQFHLASTAGNSDNLWLDESGKGRHLTSTDADYFALTTDAQGRPAYKGSDQTGAQFMLPVGYPSGSFTIYAVFNQQEPNCYFLDGAGHSLLLGINADAGEYFYGGVVYGLGVATPMNQRVLKVWRFDAAAGTARVYINDLTTPAFTGPYVARPLAFATALGHDYSAYYAPFYGFLYSFVVLPGTETDAQLLATGAYLKAAAGMV